MKEISVQEKNKNRSLADIAKHSHYTCDKCREIKPNTEFSFNECDGMNYLLCIECFKSVWELMCEREIQTYKDFFEGTDAYIDWEKMKNEG